MSERCEPAVFGYSQCSRRATRVVTIEYAEIPDRQPFRRERVPVCWQHAQLADRWFRQMNDIAPGWRRKVE